MDTNMILALKAIDHCEGIWEAVGEIDAWIDSMNGDPQLISGPLDIRAALMKLHYEDTTQVNVF